jgi:hypothetical protein
MRTISGVASAASEDTSSVGTGHACQALDGCMQPEGFDSSVLRTTVQPIWNSARSSMPKSTLTSA